MNGSQKLIDYLNFLLGGELGARDQYFIHSEMYGEWGYGKLYDRIHHEMEDETSHAQAIIRRILMLGGKPDMTVDEINVGEAQAPLSDNVRTRNTRTHKSAPQIGAQCHDRALLGSILHAVFPQRSASWPKSQLRADWATLPSISTRPALACARWQSRGPIRRRRPGA